MLDDPEVAEFLTSREKPDDPAWRPRGQDWTLLHELLAGNYDRLGHLAALLADLPVGVKQRHKAPDPFPRPETEIDKVRRQQEEEKRQQYDDRLLDALERAKQRWREQNPAAPDHRRRDI